MNNGEQRDFYRRCLYEALLRLLEEQPMERITVSRLCETAGVSRMTYYRNYADLQDILVQHFDEAFGDYHRILTDVAARAHAEGRALELHDVALTFFEFLGGGERPFFAALVRSGRAELIMERFYEYLKMLMDEAGISGGLPDSPYVRSYLAGGLYKLALDWLRNDTDESPQRMADILTALAPGL